MRAINITAAAQKQTIGVTSRFVIVCDSKIRQRVQKAIDQVIKVHELAIDCCKQGKTCQQVLEDAGKLLKESSMSYGDDFQLNFDFPMLNNINFSGFTVQGMGAQQEMSKQNLPLLLTQSAYKDYVLNDANILTVRTTCQIKIDDEKVIVTLCDITAPISADNKRAITSPYYTKSSTTPILRDYYLLIEANKVQPAAVQETAD